MTRKRTLFTGDDAWGYFLILPAIIGLVVFRIFPVVGGLVTSFTEWGRLNEPPEFVGFANYIALFTDRFPWPFLSTLWNTFFFVLTVPLGVFISIGLALLVNQNLKGITFFRALYFLPLVTAIPAIALVWQALYQPQFGVLNYLLGLIGVDGPNWLGDPSWFKPSVTIFNIWRGVGWGMMIFLAGLKGINSDYYESATIEGASRFTQFRHITFPMISPQVFFVVIMLMIWSFNTFNAIYVFGGGATGGPMGSGATVVLYLYNKSFNAGEYGVGAAAAYVLAVIVLTITFIQFKLEKKWVFYDN